MIKVFCETQIDPLDNSYSLVRHWTLTEPEKEDTARSTPRELKLLNTFK